MSNKEKIFKLRNTSWENYSLDEYIDWEFNKTLLSWYKFKGFWWSEEMLQNLFDNFMKKEISSWHSITKIFSMFQDNLIWMSDDNHQWSDNVDDWLDFDDEEFSIDLDSDLGENLKIWEVDYVNKDFSKSKEIYIIPVKNEDTIKQTIKSYVVTEDFWQIQEYIRIEQEEWWFQEWNLIDWFEECMMYSRKEDIEVELMKKSNSFKSAKLNWEDVLDSCIYYFI